MIADAPDHGEYSLLKEAIVTLARRCDSARHRDGAGFSKYDATFGKSLAAAPRWSPKQAAAAYRMARHYRRQLQGAGIEWDDIPEPDFAEVNYEGTGAPTVGAGGEPVPHPPIEFNDTHFGIRWTGFRSDLTDAMRFIPGRRWDPKFKLWVVPLAGWEQLDDFSRTHGFSYSPKAAQAIGELKLRTEASNAVDADVHIPTLVGELRPFQKAGIFYLARAKRAFLADAPGLGKTIQALATVEMVDAYPCLVIAPASLKLNWRAEARKWLPHRSVEILSGRRAENPIFAGFTSDISVINYEVLSARVEELRARGYKAVIVDESHACMHRSQRTKAVKAIVKDVPYRLLLSGTPLLNKPKELIPQLEILDRMGDIGGWGDFNRRYLGAAGTTALTELNRRLKSVCLVRRLKEDVLKELPPKQYVKVPLELDNRLEYNHARDQLLDWIRRQAEMKDQDADAAEARARRAETLVRIEKLKLLAAKGKLAAAHAWLTEFLASGEKAVVFAGHIEIQKALLEMFPGSARLLGEDDGPTRDANVRRFQNDRDCKVIVCSIQAGGLGITLTAASNVVMIEYPWNPGTLDQCIDRCHRIGQQDSVTAWYMLASNSIEEMIAGLIDSKRGIVDATTDGKEAAGGESIMAAVVQAFSQGV